MAYSRREVKDNETIMNKDLYDNLQDGIDEAKKSIQDIINANVVANAVVEE